MPTKYPTAKTRAGQYRQVFEGRAEKTKSGLTPNDLMISGGGRIVSKRAHAAGKDRGAALVAWREALTAACSEMGVSYSIPKKGTPLYKLAHEIYSEHKLEGGGKKKRKKRRSSSGKKKRRSSSKKKGKKKKKRKV